MTMRPDNDGLEAAQLALPDVRVPNYTRAELLEQMRCSQARLRERDEAARCRSEN